MARERMVTRSIDYKRVKVLCVDLTANETAFREYTYTGANKTEDGILKALKKQYDNEDVSIVKILDIKEESKLYGMKEDEFISKAVELNPDTRKRLDA